MSKRNRNKPKAQTRSGLNLDQAYLNWLKGNGEDYRRDRANPYNILGIPAYWAGVNKISDRIACLPLELWTHTGDKRVPDDRNPARKVACKNFSGWMPSEIGIKALISNTLRYGNGYALIHRDTDLIPYEITVINPEFVTIFVSQYPDGRIFPTYRVNIGGVLEDLPYTEIIHIKGLNQDGVIGYSVAEMLNTALSLNLNIYRHSEKYFERNCAMSMYISAPVGVKFDSTGTKAKEIINEVVAAIQRGEPPVLSNGGDLKSFNDNAAESQLTECKQFSLVDVANVLSCPVSMVNGQQVTSYASLEADAKNMLDNCLNPLLVQIEAEFTNKLLLEVEKDADNCFEFDRSSLDSPAPTERTTNIATLLKLNVINKHEGRIAMGYTGPAPAIEVTPAASDVSNMVAAYIISPEEGRAMLGLTGPAPVKPEPPAPIIQQPDNTGDNSDGSSDPTEDTTDSADSTPDDGADKLRSIAQASLDRLFCRLRKAAPNYRSDSQNHRNVFIESLPGHEATIHSFFDDLDAEIDAVSSADYQKVIDYRCENNKLFEVITNGE